MSNNLVPVLLLFFFFIFFLATTKSIATESKQPSSSIIFFPVNQILNETSTYLNFPSRFNNPNIELSTSTIIAAALSFLAASISSAGGIGGGGLYVPIMTIVAGLDLKTASSFSAFMVTGGSVANVGCNLFAKNARSGKALIDFDLALLLEPCMLIGVSVGVICNLVFPNWLVTLLFAVFLAWSTVKTFRNGLFYWNLETEIEKKKNRGGGGGDGDDVAESVEVALLGDFEREKEKRFPWIKLGVLVVIWFSYFGVYLLRGNQKGEGIISIEPCGITYWLLSSTQIPLTLFFTLWICFSDNIQSNQSSDHQVSSVKDIEDLRSNDRGCSNKCMFPVMALLAGVLGGVFGIGGGMLISPLLLQVGIAPEVTAATCSFMVLFSSTMSAIQYLLLGMEHTGTASIFAVVCFVASLVGLMVVQKVITEYGRASIIVFSVGIVMALSIVLMTSYGVLDIWNDFVSGSYMGFKLPC